jgi:chaperonin cofactor prefoldin
MENDSGTMDTGVTDQQTGDDGQQGFDLDTASNQLAADMFPESKSIAEDTDDTGVDDAMGEQPEKEAATDDVGAEDQAAESTVQDVAPPASWPKEMHEHWSKTPKEVRDYWAVREQQMYDGLEQYKENAAIGRPIKDVVAPYMPMLTARGMDVPTAVAGLLNAQYQLENNPKQAVANIAKAFGVNLAELVDPSAQEQQDVDPVVKRLQDQVNAIQNSYIEAEEQRKSEIRSKIESEVSEFKKANSYFDEVADDMIPFLKAGKTLQEAYDKAVWANPVTRAKESAKLQQEHEADSKRKALEAAEAAKKAAAANIRSRDTRRAPTEPNRATMRNLEAVMRESMKELKAAH